ncbi:MAG: carbohydrate kinase family protein [Erysipelotrichia bacterium]|nr:carbohydrate kinase family protein [Erysipelotrichia bacterium]
MDDYILMIAGSDIDTFYKTEQFPQAGDVTMAEPLGKRVGGCVLNTAVVCAAKGSAVKVLDCLRSNDEDTDLLVETLKEKNVDTSYIQYDKEAVNGSCLIMECENEKCIYVIEPQRPYFVYDSKMAALLNGAKYIYSLMHTLNISFETLEPLYAAKKQGAKIIFDGAGHYHSKEECELLLDLADGLFINKQSYSRLSSAFGADFCQAMVQDENKFVCITDGERGATCYVKDHSYFAESLKVKVKDSTGAGDSFAGCFLHCLSWGFSYEKCLYYASVNGAYACTGFGGMSGAVDLAILEQFARDNNYKI